MIEIMPNDVDTAFLYFHTRHSTGHEIAPFLEELQAGLPQTIVVGVDNLWVRERERQRGADIELYKVFKRRYGINADGVTLTEGQGRPDKYMFHEAIRQIKAVL